MKKKQTTAWDNVPKENRKKLVITGIILAVAACIVGAGIALIGIFNPMNGVTSEEEPEIVVMQDVVSWDMPEGTIAADKQDWSRTDSDRIYYKGERNHYLDITCYPYGVWKDDISENGTNLDQYEKIKKKDGSVVYCDRDEDKNFMDSAYVISPDENYVVEFWMTDGRIENEPMTEKRYKEKCAENEKNTFEVIDSLEWKESKSTTHGLNAERFEAGAYPYK